MEEIKEIGRLRGFPDDRDLGSVSIIYRTGSEASKYFSSVHHIDITDFSEDVDYVGMIVHMPNLQAPENAHLMVLQQAPCPNDTLGLYVREADNLEILRAIGEFKLPREKVK